MKILFLSSIVPYPPKGGHPQRTYNLMKEAARNHEIHLLAFVQKQSEFQGVKRLLEFCASAKAFSVPHKKSLAKFTRDLVLNLFDSGPYECLRYDSAEMRQAIRDLLKMKKIDLLHCDTLVLALYRSEIPDVPMVLVNHNVESVLYRRRGEKDKNLLARLFFSMQAAKLESYERKKCAEADACVVVSEQDKRSLMEIAPRCDPFVIPNGVDTEYFSPGTDEEITRNSIVFCGGLFWAPNSDGIHWFAIKVLPKIRKEIPNASLTIVGASPARKVRALGSQPGVKVTGFLDDMRPAVRSAACYIVPLMVGGGSRLKILDALSLKKAVVSTSIGCEGIDVTDGKDIVIRDGEDQFAEAVVKILRDRGLARMLGENGRRLVEEKYNWRIIGQQMENVYSAAAENCARKRGKVYAIPSA